MSGSSERSARAGPRASSSFQARSWSHDGPYRFLNHPNYLIVIGEIAVVPLIFGLIEVALLFSLLNAILLAVRIRAEEQALQDFRQ